MRLKHGIFMGKLRLSYYKKIVMLPLKDTKYASFHNCGV